MYDAHTLIVLEVSPSCSELGFGISWLSIVHISLAHVGAKYLFLLIAGTFFFRYMLHSVLICKILSYVVEVFVHLIWNFVFTSRIISAYCFVLVGLLFSCFVLYITSLLMFVTSICIFLIIVLFSKFEFHIFCSVSRFTLTSLLSGILYTIN